MRKNLAGSSHGTILLYIYHEQTYLDDVNNALHPNVMISGAISLLLVRMERLCLLWPMKNLEA